MADAILCRDGDGKLAGLTPADQRRWARWVVALKRLDYGQTLKVSFKIPRSPGFHRRHMKILQTLFESQEQFVEFERFREWLQVGAGFCDIVPGPKGKPVALSRSIAWEALDDADFAEHHAAVIAFVRTTHFRRFLWPAVDDAVAAEMVENALMEFGA